MGQKVNPNALRLDINHCWSSKWAALDNKQAAKWIIEDEKIRKYFFQKYRTAQIVTIEIERNQTTIIVNVKSGQPGLLLNKENSNVNKDDILAINKIVGRKIKVTLNVLAYDKAALSARIIAREIADAIENRVSFRVAQKMGIKKAMEAHAKGIKTNVSGRLGGVEIAREEGYSKGVIPLSTLRTNIDYACEEAHTTYGQIGVKVWINRGVHFDPNAITENKKFSHPGKKRQLRRKIIGDSKNVLKLPKQDNVKPITVKKEVKTQDKEVK